MVRASGYGRRVAAVRLRRRYPGGGRAEAGVAAGRLAGRLAKILRRPVRVEKGLDLSGNRGLERAFGPKTPTPARGKHATGRSHRMITASARYEDWSHGDRKCDRDGGDDQDRQGRQHRPCGENRLTLQCDGACRQHDGGQERCRSFIANRKASASTPAVAPAGMAAGRGTTSSTRTGTWLCSASNPGSASSPNEGRCGRGGRG